MHLPLPVPLQTQTRIPQPAGQGEVELDDARAPRRDAERALRCKRCGHGICREQDAVEVAGRHGHTFANPAGILFEIGCFAQAPGCTVRGQPTAEFSWFPGHRWSHALCGGCQQHLGWRFEGAAGSRFFGLILRQLRQD